MNTLRLSVHWNCPLYGGDFKRADKIQVRYKQTFQELNSGEAAAAAAAGGSSCT
jgi:hypothetical protein